MSDEVDAFLGRLFSTFPQLRPLYEVTLAECRALGVPGVATTDLLRQHTLGLTDRLDSDPDVASAELADFLRLLEQEYGQSDAVNDVIDDGVLPLLMPNNDEPDVTPLLGPKLTAVLHRWRSWRARPGDTALVHRLLTAVPALEPLAQENAYGDHHDVLVHPFLGDVMAREVENLLQGRTEEVHAVLAVLEEELTQDPEDPVALGFVENLPYPHEPGTEIIDMLGPRLRGELHRQRPSLHT